MKPLEKYFPLYLASAAAVFPFIFLLYEEVKINNVILCASGWALMAFIFARVVAVGHTAFSRYFSEFMVSFSVLFFGGLLIGFEGARVLPGYAWFATFAAVYYILTSRGPRVPKNTVFLTGARAYRTGERYPLKFFTMNESPLVLRSGPKETIKTDDLSYSSDGEEWRQAESIVTWRIESLNSKADYESIKKAYRSAIGDAVLTMKSREDMNETAEVFQKLENNFGLGIHIKELRFSFRVQKKQAVS